MRKPGNPYKIRGDSGETSLYVNKKIENTAFEYLIAKAETHSKSNKIPHDTFKIQEYITDNRFSTEEKYFYLS